MRNLQLMYFMLLNFGVPALISQKISNSLARNFCLMLINFRFRAFGIRMIRDSANYSVLEMFNCENPNYGNTGRGVFKRSI